MVDHFNTSRSSSAALQGSSVREATASTVGPNGNRRRGPASSSASAASARARAAFAHDRARSGAPPGGGAGPRARRPDATAQALERRDELADARAVRLVARRSCSSGGTARAPSASMAVRSAQRPIGALAIALVHHQHVGDLQEARP